MPVNVTHDDIVSVCNEMTGGIVMLNDVPAHFQNDREIWNAVPSVRAIKYATAVAAYIQKHLPDVYGLDYVITPEHIVHSAVALSGIDEARVRYVVPGRWSMYIAASNTWLNTEKLVTTNAEM